MVTPRPETPPPPAPSPKPKPAQDPPPAAPIKVKPTREKPPAKDGDTYPFLREALLMARHLKPDHLLFICEVGSPPIEKLKKIGLKRKIIVATSSEKVGAQCEDEGVHYQIIPAYAFDRFEKIKVALAACVTSGLLSQGMQVLCMAGQTNSPYMDTCLMTKVGEHSEEQAAIGVLQAGTQFPLQVLETILKLALTVGYEGFEGAPVGTIFVVGDTTAVLEKSKQLTLNPFQGYSEDEKNILDPKIRDAIKNFCLLDGAFVIREDGVVLAAGRYLRAIEDNMELPLGLGTRNAAAMAVTKVSQAIAIVVSKTTGSVRVYKDGVLAIELRQPRRRF